MRAARSSSSVIISYLDIFTDSINDMLFSLIEWFGVRFHEIIGFYPFKLVGVSFLVPIFMLDNASD